MALASRVLVRRPDLARLSRTNQLLVALAWPDMTFVAGFKAWLKRGIERFGGYATDEVALAPEPFDARHHWSGSWRLIWSESLSALGALEQVRRGRRDTVVLSGSLTAGVPELRQNEIREGCRIGAVLFVVGGRPPARGGASLKERS